MTVTSSRMPAVGSRSQVMHGHAVHTSGGLTKSDLKYNKHGSIVSRKRSALGKKSLSYLVKKGYVAKKGKMLLGKKMLSGKSAKKSTRKSSKNVTRR